MHTYQPGYLLDANTLVAVLARRTGCVSRDKSYSERQSYPVFERWVAEAAALNDDAALAYTAGILADDPGQAQTVLDTCHAEDRECAGDLGDMLYEVRLTRWF